MWWFRSQKLKSASLVLFALACQFAFAFGHVHLDRSAGTSNWVIAAALGKAIAAPAGKVTSADLPTSPRQKSPSSLGHDFCAICASISLAGAVIVQDAPTLLPGISFSKELHWSFAATRAASIDHFRFNARGPPTA